MVVDELPGPVPVGSWGWGWGVGWGVVVIQVGQLGDAPVMAGLLRGGEEGRHGVEGHGDAHHAAPEAQDVRMVVLAGEGGRRHIVHHRRPDTGDLVGRHGDADPRPAGTDAQLSPAPRHGPPDGGTEVGVVHPQFVVRWCPGL